MRNIFYILIFNFLYAQGVPAGTTIENKAFLNYKVGTEKFSLESNKVIDIVDQKIDMKIVCQESDSVIVGVGETQRAMAFKLVNRGNGKDSYSFTPIFDNSSDFEVENRMIYQDNGDGLFSSSSDSLVNELELDADENATLFFVSDIPPDALNVSINGLKVYSENYKELAYGESKRLDTYYALMAAKENALSDMCRYKVSNLALKLEKSATLSSDKLYKGSTIHYSLAVKVIGKGTLSNIVVEDNIPEGTVYIPNSLQLDGVNNGDFNGTAISMNLGEIIQEEENSDTKYLISFDVKVN